MIATLHQRLTALILKVSQLSLPVILLLTLVLQTGIMELFAVFWWRKVSEALVNDSLLSEFLSVVIAGPIVETVVFQYAIIDFIINRFRSPALAIVVSAFCFCLLHYYSLQYMVATFVSGMLFAFAFLVFRAKNRSAIWWVFVVHALYNLFIFIMRHTAA